MDKLHDKARRAIEAGEEKFRDAAEYLAEAQKLGASQRQSAKAIGMSPAWVSALQASSGAARPGLSPPGLMSWASWVPVALASLHHRARRLVTQSGRDTREPACTSVPLIEAPQF